MALLDLWPLTVISTFVLLLPVSVVLYRLYLHPLAWVPGPKLAAITSQWHAHQIRTHRPYALELHAKYGPAVRIGPNTVVFNSEEAFNLMYRAGSAFEKSDWYSVACDKPKLWEVFGRHQKPDTLDFLVETNMERYRLQRRLVGNIYSASNMKKYEGKIHQTMDRICERLKKLDGKEVRLAEWMHIIVLECIGELAFSSAPPRMLEEGTDFGMLDDGLWGMWRRFSVMGLWPNLTKISSAIPGLSGPMKALMGVAKKPTPGSPTFSIWPWIAGNVMESIANGKKDDWMPGDNILSQLISLHKAKPEFNETYVRNMNFTNFGAGHDTMASSLTAMFSRVCTDPEIQKGVEAECREGGLKSAFEEGKISTLTGAAIRESMRLHPISNMPFLRKSPASGSSLHGYHFPSGTDMGCNTFVLHRNPAIYGNDAAEFKPFRWLGDNELQLKTMDRVNLIWGAANRSCPGQNMARMSMGIIVPRLFKEFNIKVNVPEGEFDNAPPFFLTIMWNPMASFIPRT